ncbi:MAG TPA: DUF5995 family protein [Thermoleophilaceae bacterium]|nr:DUF5995 family protein [Thermoleophilaceae bacterium]
MLICVAVLALPAAASAEDPPQLDWNPLLPGLPQTYEPSKDADCVDGDPQCVERTLTEMYRRFDTQYSTCDHNAAFGITYIRVTESIRRAILDGVYQEPKYLGHIDRVFARMYFQSYDAWKAGKRAQVPMAWREAWDAGRSRSVTGLGNLLLSMNAHINRDMPYLMESTGLTKPDGSTRKIDHDRGNKVLNTLYDDVIKELAARFDPTVDDVDVPGLLADDAALFQLLQGWREGVWRNAELLNNADNAGQRKAASDYIEQYALTQARMIKNFTTTSGSGGRDAHCAAYRRAHREVGGIARADRPKRGNRVSRKRKVKVRVRCPEIIRDCRGRLALMRGRRVLARTTLPSIRVGGSRVVTLKVSRKTYRTIKRRKRLAVTAVTGSPSPWGTTRTATRPLRLK